MYKFYLNCTVHCSFIRKKKNGAGAEIKHFWFLNTPFSILSTMPWVQTHVRIPCSGCRYQGNHTWWCISLSFFWGSSNSTRDVFCLFFKASFVLILYCCEGWSTAWLTCLSQRRRPVYRPADYKLVTTHASISWLAGNQLTGRSADWPTISWLADNQLTGRQSADWPIGWLADNQLTGWQTADWAISWLADYQLIGRQSADWPISWFVNQNIKVVFTTK